MTVGTPTPDARVEITLDLPLQYLADFLEQWNNELKDSLTSSAGIARAKIILPKTESIELPLY